MIFRWLYSFQDCCELWANNIYCVVSSCHGYFPWKIPVSFPQCVLCPPFTATTATADCQQSRSDTPVPSGTAYVYVTGLPHHRSLTRPSPCPMGILFPRPITTIDCLLMTTFVSSPITAYVLQVLPSYICSSTDGRNFKSLDEHIRFNYYKIPSRYWTIYWHT